MNTLKRGMALAAICAGVLVAGQAHPVSAQANTLFQVKSGQPVSETGICGFPADTGALTVTTSFATATGLTVGSPITTQVVPVRSTATAGCYDFSFMAPVGNSYYNVKAIAGTDPWVATLQVVSH